MNYSPHILLVRRLTEERDAYNRVIASSEEWVEVCRCRCDDNADSIVSTDNSIEYIPKYHIVAEKTREISNGDKVRVLNEDGSIRGEGKADRVRVLNYLDYTDFYA